MKSKQKSIIITCTGTISNDELNQYLDKDWTIKQIVPFGDTGKGIVIIEKEDKDKESKLGFKS